MEHRGYSVLAVDLPENELEFGATRYAEVPLGHLGRIYWSLASQL
jgi:hypothetical protein